MITTDLRVYRIMHEQTDVQAVYWGRKMLWPTSPLDEFGFLKYDQYNFRREFKGQLASTEVELDTTIVYNNVSIISSFQGLDTGVQEYIPEYDEFQKFDSTNFSTSFNGFIDPGATDQAFVYDISNMQTSFLGLEPVTNGNLDTTLVYNGIAITNSFQGLDTGVQEYIPEYDEFQKFDSTNFSTSFNNDAILGEFDQDLGYNYNNIQTEFTTLEPVTNGNLDTTIVYNNVSIISRFQGPDTGVQEYIPEYDEFQKFDSTNFSTSFNGFIDPGATDQAFVYDISNIQTSFLGLEPVTNGNLDTTLVYNGIAITNSFQGPDTGVQEYIPEYFSFQKFDSTNFSTSFKHLSGDGIYDSTLGYSATNIALEFI